MRVTIVYDNEAWQPSLEAAWGFSCLVEDNRRTAKQSITRGSRTSPK